MATTAARNDRIALRTSTEQKSFLEKGASATGQNLTEFVLSSAQEKAEMVLADQNRFVISPKQWDAFVTAQPYSKYCQITAEVQSGRSILRRRAW
jgi:uncharacterized protein (DUF1778 family)